MGYFGLEHFFVNIFLRGVSEKGLLCILAIRWCKNQKPKIQSGTESWSDEYKDNEEYDTDSEWESDDFLTAGEVTHPHVQLGGYNIEWLKLESGL